MTDDWFKCKLKELVIRMETQEASSKEYRARLDRLEELQKEDSDTLELHRTNVEAHQFAQFTPKVRRKKK
jgi:hypothetical protein